MLTYCAASIYQLVGYDRRDDGNPILFTPDAFDVALETLSEVFATTYKTLEINYADVRIRPTPSGVSHE